jgi:hypothetical protein
MHGLSQPSQWSHEFETRLTETIALGVECCECPTVTLALWPTTTRTARVTLMSFQINIVRKPTFEVLIFDPVQRLRQACFDQNFGIWPATRRPRGQQVPFLMPLASATPRNTPAHPPGLLIELRLWLGRGVGFGRRPFSMLGCHHRHRGQVRRRRGHCHYAGDGLHDGVSGHPHRMARQEPGRLFRGCSTSTGSLVAASYWSHHREHPWQRNPKIWTTCFTTV